MTHPFGEMPIDELVDQLWSMAHDVALEDGAKYRTLREAIFRIEFMRSMIDSTKVLLRKAGGPHA